MGRGTIFNPEWMWQTQLNKPRFALERALKRDRNDIPWLNFGHIYPVVMAGKSANHVDFLPNWDFSSRDFTVNTTLGTRWPQQPPTQHKLRFAVAVGYGTIKNNVFGIWFGIISEQKFRDRVPHVDGYSTMWNIWSTGVPEIESLHETIPFWAQTRLHSAPEAPAGANFESAVFKIPLIPLYIHWLVKNRIP